MFYNVGACVKCNKNFFACNLQFFVISQSVCQTRLEKLARDKHSSLLCKFVNYGRKKFYNVGACVQCYKNFLLVIQEFILSQSVCQTRLEKLARDKHSSLLCSYVNYGRKKFYNIVAWTDHHQQEQLAQAVLASEQHLGTSLQSRFFDNCQTLNSARFC